ncbi:MAG: aspartate aminotransferase [Rhodobacteraceae bacterium]|nr:aspartate aminotransferase [Paracoccaceae bacterium]
MRFSKNMEQISMSKTAEIADLALSLKERGKKVINMASGELSFKPDSAIRKEACRVINKGETLYTQVAGLYELREQISKKLQKDLNVKYTSDEIIVSNGGKQVIFNAFQSTINRGDEVIIVSPYWVSYPEIIKFCGGKSKILNSKRAEDFSINVDELEKLITAKTKWLILNSPNNPTGVVYTRESLKKIIQVLNRHPNVWVLLDDIYEKLNFSSKRSINLINIDTKLKRRSLLVNGFSKGYSMTGWRLGYGAGPKILIEAMKKIQSQSTSAANTIAQNAAIKALQLDEDYFEDIKTSLIKRREIVTSALANLDGFRCKFSQGAFYIFPSIESFLGKRLKGKDIIYDDTSFCLQLLSSKHVAVVPGSSFGSRDSIRISYALTEKDLRIGCKRIKQFCENLV